MSVQVTYQRLALVSPFNDRACKSTKLNIVRCKRSSHARVSHPPNPDHQTTTPISTGVERDGKFLLVNPKPKKGIASQFFDFFENLIVKLMHDSKHPSQHLSGIFAPVHEETPPQPNLLLKDTFPKD